jgi:uncharacterized membrane protein YqgA involved in biofilm formation
MRPAHRTARLAPIRRAVSVVAHCTHSSRDIVGVGVVMGSIVGVWLNIKLPYRIARPHVIVSLSSLLSLSIRLGIRMHILSLVGLHIFLRTVVVGRL